MSWLELMKAGVLVASLFAMVNQYCQARKKRFYGITGAWVHYALSIMMVYWAFYYLRSLLDYPVFNNHQIFVRAPLMLTIALIGATGAYGSRRFR